ncbi:sensor histidine kinase [Streptomyces chrestomyceticus]|uniref:sensor histidine kinase n=1 Tax=Streptomyces chrestomyceticus TaxID=68185 RepID=UPI0036BB0818
MRCLYDFFRRHPTVADSVWGLVLLGFSALHVASGGDLQFQRLVEVPAACALSLAVALRRQAPEQMLLLAIATGIGQLVMNLEPFPGDAAMPVIVYTVASAGAPWARRLALLGSLGAASLSAWRWPSPTQTPWSYLITVVITCAPFGLAWTSGYSQRVRHAHYAQLEERVGQLQRTRAAAAVAAARTRIASELHDIVAHNVAAMVVQAEGAAHVLEASPNQSKQALSAISETGRLALAEMRRTQGLLRESNDRDGDYAPQPGVDQLSDLIDQARGAGLPVDFTVDGTLRPLPSSVELTAYRTVQEALTNTCKHGGTHAHATVHLTYTNSRLHIRVDDDGRGTHRELSDEDRADGFGRGLNSLRERIALAGGTLTAGPRPGGGFRINATLPLTPISAT